MRPKQFFCVELPPCYPRELVYLGNLSADDAISKGVGVYPASYKVRIVQLMQL